MKERNNFLVVVRLTDVPHTGLSLSLSLSAHTHIEYIDRYVHMKSFQLFIYS